MSPELSRLELLFLIVAIASCIVGYFAATQPRRRVIWSLLRAGLAYAMLWIRKAQADRLKREKNKSDRVDL